MGAIGSRRSAVLALLLLVPAPTIGTLAAMLIAPGPIGQTVYGLCKIWLLMLPLLWTMRVDRNPLSWPYPRRAGLWMGGCLGLVIGGLILSGHSVIGTRWIDVAHVRRMAEQSGIGSGGRYLGFAAYLVLVNSLLEEYVWRWFVFRKCEVIVPSGSAVPAAALLFTLHHVVALGLQFSWRMTVLASLGVLVGGMLFSWLYARYRSIWPGYLCHVLIDVAVLAIGWKLIFS
jgi:membrane protease YdiL (CAAX protease family)